MADIKTFLSKDDPHRPSSRLSAAASELRVLVTGFVPFGGDPYNPSGVAANAIDGRRVDALGPLGYYSARIIGRGNIPVVFGDQPDSAADVVLHAILDTRPDVVICLGQGDDLRFRVELRARDNTAHHDPRIRSGSPEYRSSYTTGLDADRVVAALRAGGADASTSADAGFYVCEDLFYHVMRFVETRPGDVMIRAAGFIHVPRYVVVDVGARDPLTPPAVPNHPARQGISPIAQSLINDCIYRAVEATVAGLPVFMDSPLPDRGGERIHRG
jgi:pyroglutamyl-peptidase